jgi:MOSC domain-containing protein YiiM
MDVNEGNVEAVCISIAGLRVAKAPQDQAYVGPHGLEGDRHAGESVRLRSGTVVANGRQWSAVSSEEVAELCADLGVAVFAPGALGENLRLSGLRLGSLVAGSVLEFPSGARLLVSGQNDPCINAAMALARAYGGNVGREFIPRAMGRRGVVGSVLAPGLVRPGDRVRVLAAPAPSPRRA